MRKKEVTEIRKLFKTPEDTSVLTVSVCVAKPDETGKHIKDVEFTMGFANVEENEAFKYLEIFNKGLSGTLGKSLYNVQRPKDHADAWRDTEHLRKSRLEGEAEVSVFHDRLIESLENGGETYIFITAHGIYDVPASKNAVRMDTDAYEGSDDVYEYLLCVKCQVVYSKPGLAIDSRVGTVRARNREWIIGPPVASILYPAFNDRQEDVNAALFYAKGGVIDSMFHNVFFGEPHISTAEEEAKLLSDALGQAEDGCLPFTDALSVYDEVRELERLDDGTNELLEADRTSLKKIVERSVENEDSRRKIEKYLDTAMQGDDTVSMRNIVNPKQAVVKGDGFSMKIDGDRVSRLYTKKLDGQMCLVVPLTSSSLFIDEVESRAGNGR